MAEATPDPDCITVKACGTEVVTSLDGYHMPAASDPPTGDTAACIALTELDYIDRSLILAEINGQQNVLGLCGNTGLGTYYYGCLSGGLNARLFVQGDDASAGDCDFVATGEEVTAQVCKTQCEGLVPFAIGDAASIVVIAKIGLQWFIVNVLDRGFATNIPDFKTPVCNDACCDIGFKEIEVTIGTGCGSLSGETFRLSGAGFWTGRVKSGVDTFSMTIKCTIGESGSEDWSVTGGCISEASAQSFSVSCSDGMSGTARFTGMICSQCSVVDVSFRSVTPVERDCNTVILTGEEVVMEACGLPELDIGDQVVMARVPKLGSACPGSTGTGTSAPQWQMIQACSDTLNCGAPCPPPEPPFDAECCDWDSLQAPETLVGVLTLDSDDSSCTCSAAVVFQLDPLVQGDPPIWQQVGSTCGTSTGTGTSGNALQGIGGLIITCGSSTSTGTGSPAGTGTGSGALQYSFSLDNATVAGPVAGQGFCEPLLITWSDIETGVEHCDGGTFPPGYVRLSLEVTEA